MKEKVNSDFLNIMIERGFIHQITDRINLDIESSKSSITGYIGFDCTAPSLHVGSLIQIMMLRWFQKTGNKPIVLMGGGTTKVGDPSGKDAARPVLSNKEIFENQKSIEREQNLSFLEFNYSLLQAFDFLQLNIDYECKLQMGGSDQWGNIITGIDLIRKKTSNQAFGLTSPLLTTSSGSKMGKSANGAVWLNENQLSNWDFWQYWRNTEDPDVIKFLKLFTELPINEINKLEKLKGAEINEAKIILADEVTKLCRNKEEAAKISAASTNLFNKIETEDSIPNVNLLNYEISIIDALKKLNFIRSNGEARRLIRGNGARINDIIVNDENYVLSINDFKKNKVKISSGKKRHGLLTFN